MSTSNSISVIFKTYFRLGIKAKRTRYFFLFGLLPIVLLVLVNLFDTGGGSSRSSSLAQFYIHAILPFYFQLFIPIIALFFGSSVINDEIDNRTLIFLTTTPAAKSGILIGKFLSHLILSFLIVLPGFFVCFFWGRFAQAAGSNPIQELLRFSSAAVLALLAYQSLFCMLGTLMQKSILTGLFFIFGWESIVQFLPGSTQKLTLAHYIKSLLPRLPSYGHLLARQLEPSGKLESVLTLAILALLFLAVAVWIFKRKEYLLSNSD